MVILRLVQLWSITHNFTDPENSLNTVWKVAVSGGTANVFMGTGEPEFRPVLDSGFDFSGNGLGQLVFDIKVNSIDAGRKPDRKNR